MLRPVAQLLYCLCSSVTIVAAQSISEALEPIGELSELRNFLAGSAELTSWLDSDTPITLLAPNNDAFKQLVSSVDRVTAEKLLTQHTLDGAYEDFKAIDSPMIRMARQSFLEDDKISGGRLVLVETQDFSNLTAFTLGLDQYVLTDVAESVKFDSGSIHILDGYLTAPRSFSSSTSSRAATAFSEAVIGDAANAAGPLEIDSLSNITVFLPIDYVWERVGNIVEDWSRSMLDRFLSYHVIHSVLTPEDVTKSPSAGDFASLEGTGVTISSVGDETFINNAKVIGSYPKIFKGGLIYTTYGVMNPDNTTTVGEEPNTSDVAFEGAVLTSNFTFPVADQSSSNTTSSTPSDQSEEESRSGLSTGAKAAIGVGVPAAVIIFCLVGAYFITRRRAAARRSLGDRPSVNQPWGAEASMSQKELLKPVTAPRRTSYTIHAAP